MEALWSVGGLILGVAVTFFVMKSRLARVTAEMGVERIKLDALEEARQKLVIELALIRSNADRLTELVAQAAKDSETITSLEKKCSSLSTSIEEREKGLSEERRQFEILKGELKEQIHQLSKKTAEDNETVTELEKKCSVMATSIEEREKALVEERQQFILLKKEFKAQFAELSANALKDNSEIFLNNAKNVLALQHQEAGTDLAKRQEEIKQLVKPIQDGIKAVGDAAKEMESKREKAFGSIEEQIKQSIVQAAEVARQTGGLKDALKKPNVRGRWGEVQLRNCIELERIQDSCTL